MWGWECILCIVGCPEHSWYLHRCVSETPLLVVTTKNVSRVYEMPPGIEDESSLEERHDSSQPWFTFHWAIFQLWDLERGFNLCEP